MVVFANAVKQSPIKGLCCLIVPFYIFLFYFDGFDHSKKTLIGAGWLGGLVVGLGILFSVAYGG